jgi:hypothetical protein
MSAYKQLGVHAHVATEGLSMASLFGENARMEANACTHDRNRHGCYVPGLHLREGGDVVVGQGPARGHSYSHSHSHVVTMPLPKLWYIKSCTGICWWVLGDMDLISQACARLLVSHAACTLTAFACTAWQEEGAHACA